MSNGPIPFDSVLLQDLLSEARMRAIWTEERMVAAWMQVERAIIEVQCELGMVPEWAATRICETLGQNLLPLERVRDHAIRSGHLMVGFLRAFREVCGDAAEHFHLGPTTQDILDTGLALQMVAAADRVREQALQLEALLCGRALQEKDTVMMGRTHEQHALPTTFGLVLAAWASEIRDHIDRLDQSEPRWRIGSVAGGVGAQNAFVELSNQETARELERRVCRRLGLFAPDIQPQGRLDRFAEVVCALASLCGTLARIGLQLRTMERPEVAEIEVTYGDEACSSSTMPNKRNPETIERVEGLAELARGYAQATLSLRMADHRDSTRIPVLYTAVPGAFLLASRALASITSQMESVQANRAVMRANLDHPNVLGQAAAERLMIALYRKTGKKHWAHTRLSECSAISRKSRRPLRLVIEESNDLGAYFSPSELDALFDLATYTGTAAVQAEQAASRIMEKNRAAREARVPVDPPQPTGSPLTQSVIEPERLK
jgi:adenylosuccinate lyase